VSFEQKPYRKLMMQAWGGECLSSPSSQTRTGRRALAEAPDSPGSLGLASSEAIETVLTDQSGQTRYSLGSVFNHTLLHQTIIGLEARHQLKKAREPQVDVVIGCAGGGSNFAGLAFPFLRDKMHGASIALHPVEPVACPTLTRGPFVYDYSDVSRYSCLLPMHSLGHLFVPPPIHAGGLRFHGMAPLVSHIVRQGLATPRSVSQRQCFEAAVTWARTEGYIPAPETAHAIAAVIDEARRAKQEGREKVILFCWSGHGLLDLAAYDAHLRGRLQDHPLSQEELERNLEAIAGLPSPEQHNAACTPRAGSCRWWSWGWFAAGAASRRPDRFRCCA
jgi:tryptophan synthase beta chain